MKLGHFTGCEIENLILYEFRWFHKKQRGKEKFVVVIRHMLAAASSTKNLYQLFWSCEFVFSRFCRFWSFVFVFSYQTKKHNKQKTMTKTGSLWVIWYHNNFPCWPFSNVSYMHGTCRWPWVKQKSFQLLAHMLSIITSFSFSLGHHQSVKCLMTWVISEFLAEVWQNDIRWKSSMNFIDSW